MGTMLESVSQVLESHETSHKLLPNAKRTKFLTTTLGQQLPYFVLYGSNSISVFHISCERYIYKYDLPSSANVIDIDYFPTSYGDFGIIVAVTDPSAVWGAENFVMAFSESASTNQQKRLEIVASLGLPQKPTIVKTLYTSEEMAQNAADLKLFPSITRWKHVVAIGAINAHCFVGELTEHSVDDAKNETFVKMFNNKPSNLLKGFVKCPGVFRYVVDELHKDYKASTVSVTALGMLPRSRTLLIGLSMGGIVTASINPSNCMKALMLCHERCIRFLVPLEPEDDPDRFEWFIAAADGSPRHPIAFHLWKGGFRKDEPEEERYDNPHFSVSLEHSMNFGTKWISMRTLTHDRQIEITGSSSQRKSDDDPTTLNSNNSSLANTSITHGSTFNRSLVAFTYEKMNIPATEERKHCVAGGLFDINGYYYKRLPTGIIRDKTYLRQCPFLSVVRSTMPAHVHDVAVMLEVPTDVECFSSNVSDADQLFYPSSLSFDRVIVATSDGLVRTKISSIQNDALNLIANASQTVIRLPKKAADILIAVGVVPNGVSSPDISMDASPLTRHNAAISSEEKIVLTALLHYGRVADVIRTVNESTFDESHKNEIANWAFFEACDYRNTISDRTLSVFEGSAAAMSPLTNKTVVHGIRLFTDILKLLRSCSNESVSNGRVPKYMSAVKCSENHTRLLRQFLSFGVVPMDTRMSIRMREAHRERVEAAEKNGSILPIQQLLRRLHISTSKSHFWCGKSHDEWYPPSALNLLEPILNLDIPERTKRELVSQFLLDWMRACPREKEFVDSDDSLARRVLVIIGDQVLGATIEKVMFVLSNEQKATQLGRHDGLSFSENNVKKPGMGNADSKGNGFEFDLNMGNIISKTEDVEYERIRRNAEKFKQRPASVSNDDEWKRYQMFLFGRQNYSELSEEFVEQNQVLKSLLPRLVKKSVSNKQKTDCDEKESEIRSAVQAMIARGPKSVASSQPTIPSMVFATNEVRNHGMLLAQGAIRKRVAAEPKSGRPSRPVSPPFAPPSAKRRSLNYSQADESVRTTTIGERTPPHTGSNDTADIVAAIQTPARFLRRAHRDIETSPTDRLSTTALRAPCSILKTAKALQSPSRGRIRFAEGIIAPPALNFDEDDDDDDMDVSEPVESVNEEETFEVETTFEVQADDEQENNCGTEGEEFEVYEDACNEVPQTEDVQHLQEEKNEQMDEKETGEVVKDGDENATAGRNTEEQDDLDKTFDMPEDAETKELLVEAIISDATEEVTDEDEEEEVERVVPTDVVVERTGEAQDDISVERVKMPVEEEMEVEVEKTEEVQEVEVEKTEEVQDDVSVPSPVEVIEEGDVNMEREEVVQEEGKTMEMQEDVETAFEDNNDPEEVINEMKANDADGTFTTRVDEDGIERSFEMQNDADVDEFSSRARKDRMETGGMLFTTSPIPEEEPAVVKEMTDIPASTKRRGVQKVIPGTEDSTVTTGRRSSSRAASVTAVSSTRRIRAQSESVEEKSVEPRTPPAKKEPSTTTGRRSTRAASITAVTSTRRTRGASTLRAQSEGVEKKPVEPKTPSGGRTRADSVTKKPEGSTSRRTRNASEAATVAKEDEIQTPRSSRRLKSAVRTATRTTNVLETIKETADATTPRRRGRRLFTEEPETVKDEKNTPAKKTSKYNWREILEKELESDDVVKTPRRKTTRAASVSNAERETASAKTTRSRTVSASTAAAGPSTPSRRGTLRATMSTVEEAPTPRRSTRRNP